MSGTYTSPADEAFFAAIGRLTISWAHLELGLDCVIDVVHHALGGKHVEPKVPRALQRKIEYLRTILNRMPLPDDAARGYESLFVAIEAAAQTRHDMIHGAVVEHVERSGEATMVRLIHHKDRVTPRRFKATTTSILKAAVEANRLGGKALWWATELQKFVSELPQRSGAQELS